MNLRTLVACRLSTSVTLGAFSISKDPTNEYLKLHAKPGREKLVKFWSKDKKEIDKLYNEAI